MPEDNFERTCEVVRVAATHESQGNYVIMNKDDFDPKKHKLYDGPENPVVEAETAPVPEKTVADIDAYIALLQQQRNALVAVDADKAGGNPAGGWGGDGKAPVAAKPGK